jgi:cytochrome c peroxidase
MTTGIRYLILALLLAVAVGACSGDSVDPAEQSLVNIPSDFPPLPVPGDNPLTAEKIALGKKLFYDKRLSRTEEVSCGSCHLQEHAFADPKPLSIGVHGLKGNRNAPTLANMAYNTSFFWDGGVPTLEQQAIAPILNPVEMDMTIGEVVTRLAADPEYVDMFRRAFDTTPSPGTVTRALASFVRTLVSSDSRFDRFNRGDSSALTASEKRGMNLFLSEKAECFHCHIGFNLSNNTFKNNAFIGEIPDSGRAKITENPTDLGKFKVPTLRNIELTSPYMHDGSLATLEDVLEHYTTLKRAHGNLDPNIHPLQLSTQDKADLIAFMKSFTDQKFVNNPRFQPE